VSVDRCQYFQPLTASEFGQAAPLELLVVGDRVGEVGGLDDVVVAGVAEMTLEQPHSVY